MYFYLAFSTTFLDTIFKIIFTDNMFLTFTIGYLLLFKSKQTKGKRKLT